MNVDRLPRTHAATQARVNRANEKIARRLTEAGWHVTPPQPPQSKERPVDLQQKAREFFNFMNVFEPDEEFHVDQMKDVDDHWKFQMYLIREALDRDVTVTVKSVDPDTGGIGFHFDRPTDEPQG